MDSCILQAYLRIFLNITYVTIAGKPMELFSTARLTHSATRQLKSAQMDCFLCYMVIKQAFEYETKGIDLQTQPK